MKFGSIIEIKILTEIWVTRERNLQARSRMTPASNPSSIIGRPVSRERVFSLLRVMYGEQQTRVLADHLQMSLMSRYNKRVVG